MPTVWWLPVLCVVFAACRWSGRLLDRHYGDRTELGAVMLVGLCVLGPFVLGAAAADVLGLPVRWLLAAVMTGGLLVGRRRPVR